MIVLIIINFIYMDDQKNKKLDNRRPVVNKNRLVGIVTETDFVKVAAHFLEDMATNAE